ncbi:ankyrin repeat, SAM and basic leucine zipper domain-containing protein 1 [Cololabis saira]|uniref:ankyrin repeat, SAM and basic leucine zipper domain-containing protein 1 n=1 Tax=Cololabis saira TaxID=129043 RepID=UPI002AD50FD8|nr:ankyrin repeat, SAM and basic leucine zipper domain-containing protein 1 [Cololabis saira]
MQLWAVSSNMELAFPAGDESDASNDEWDLGHYSAKPTSGIQRSHTKLASLKVGKNDDISVLKRAISHGDVDTVEKLLDKGMNVETRLHFDWTPLMCAVRVANYDLTKLLLDRGASANFSKDHSTVLMVSCTATATEDKIACCVELLLSRSADPNMVDRTHMTCLMFAARDGYSKVINLLVSHGAKIDDQNTDGYTALSIAAQYGREQAVLKLLQLGANKAIKTKAGKSPANLAEHFKHTEICRILKSSSLSSALQTSTSREEATSNLMTKPETPAPKQSVLNDLELLLHGLNLGHLSDIITENDVTWSHLLTMEREDLEKIGITDPAEQHKVLSAVQQMHLDKVDLDTINQLGVADSGSEDLLNFLISVNQQCSYLTEMVQDVICRFPRRASQLVFSLDPNKEAQAVCNQLVVQTKDLEKEITCLHHLLSQVNTSVQESERGGGELRQVRRRRLGSDRPESSQPISQQL